MSRQDFCNQLAECRETQRCGKNELCRRAGFGFQQLQALEQGSRNLRMRSVFRYLEAIDAKLMLKDELHGSSVTIDNYEQLESWFLTRLKAWSVAGVSRNTGYTMTSVSNVINQKYAITIDMLLSACSLFDCEVIVLCN